MSRATLSSIFQVGLDILSTLRDSATKSILANLGDVVSEQSESDEAEWWQHVGFASRPSKASKGKVAAQAIILRSSGRDAVIGSRDLRGQELAGNLAEGETCVYASGENGTAQARILLKKTGMISLYTREGNTSTGGGMVFMMDPATDSITMTNSLGIGIIIDPDGIHLTAKESSLNLQSDGNFDGVARGVMHIDGSSVVIGSAAVPVANAALTGPTGISGKPSVKVLIE